MYVCKLCDGDGGGRGGGMLDTLQLMKPAQTFSRIHGNSGVTDVRCHGNVVFSCGRNGRYCQFAVDNGNLLQLISTNKVSDGIFYLLSPIVVALL